MSARSKARKAALDLLYEADIKRTSVSALLEIRKNTLETLIRDYTVTLVEGVNSHKARIDELIMTYARGWDFDRMPVIDRNILRLGIYELLWEQELDSAVAIDQALELANTLSTDDSATYINGVLGAINEIKGDLAL